MRSIDSAPLWITVGRDSDPLGYVAIDSFVAGRSCGGLRLLPDVEAGEIRDLARAMTLKYGFLGLPQGGAKAGVRGDPEADETVRRQRLLAFGRAIAPLLRERVYVPGADMGTSAADIRWMLCALGMNPNARELRANDSGFYTALTVAVSARAAMSHLGLTLAGRTAAIEGFGKVGAALASLLSGAGVRVVAVSTSQGALFHPDGLDVGRLCALSEGAETGSEVVNRYVGAERLDRRALPALPVDLLCPCARHDSVHEGNAAQVAASVVCPGANNPLTPAAEKELGARGVLCVPDFVANCGGVLGGTMEFAAVGRGRIVAFIERHLGDRVGALLREAARQGVSPRDVAVPLALRRHEQVQRSALHPTPLQRCFALGLELYRRDLVPAALVRALALRFFELSLADW
jgi:glutamate dehydrogenase (NAD(P)+)